MLDRVRPAVARALAVVSLLVLVSGCGGAEEPVAAPSAATAAGPTASEATGPPPATSDPVDAEAPAGTDSDPVMTAEASPAPQPPSGDELAGVRSREVPPRGNGATAVVAGSVPAPGTGREHRVRVEVEGGLDVDGEAFASFVLDTLNDPRSWSRDGLTFSRTDGDADIVVVLASPETSARMCAPLVTNGTLSCRQGPRAILTMHRWAHGMEDYGEDVTGYRRYLVNHEVGHVLGHGHVACPGPGLPAPVMQQQTKDVDPCVPNSWPYP